MADTNKEKEKDGLPSTEASYILDETDSDGNSLFHDFDYDLFDDHEDEMIEIAELSDLLDEETAAELMNDTIQELIQTSKDFKKVTEGAEAVAKVLSDFGSWLALLEEMIEKLKDDHYLKAFVSHAINEEKEALAIIRILNEILPVIRSQKNEVMEKRVKKAINHMIGHIQRLAK